MAHTPDHLTLTVSWDHPGLMETLEGIIAKAWADGFRHGVNMERQNQGPFGSEELARLYRDWRGYGPGVQFPGGAFARARIVAEDRAIEMQENAPAITREVFEQAMQDGQVRRV